MFVPFDPQPPAASLPELFPTPFRPGPPHPLAALAAEQTQAALALLPWLEPQMFEGPLGGKMIGVLVMRHADGRVGYLRGFAGMLGGQHEVEGFVPPAFDVPRYERLWDDGGARITALDIEVRTMRHAASPDPAAQELLQETVQTQRELSRSLHAELLDTYLLANARGEQRKLCALFDPLPPPGGSGDCAAPKLLARAFALGARPLALAEFWWGGSPPGGGRQHGVFYPACRGRCAKILPFMLEGLACEPAPDVGIEAVSADAPWVVHEDDAILVVEKPSGLLSVPGRGPRRRDSVEYRLQQRAGLEDDSWPRLVHRLDVATSGLLIAAKHKPAYVAMQRQFSSREVDKRYEALVRGAVAGDGGVIDLPLSRDLADRPRQIHDPVRGKPALTRWRVLERALDTTRVALFPKTGRTHQLRLHAAHPSGLDAPIIGDLLYGFGGDGRLMLHAASVGFRHPITGEALTFDSTCPF
ncbi:Ribosomal large subunit pseudouridine synthase A [Enhygromyxa salina]|uniref:Ribosomal large subunit pseudouridine synthase A n=1 Tax=Enhygromyxa salina TaxID=215803 RepID=A0A0C2D370_9BACT|nr:RluA family pseudouridine synthase [Enhygromyxa salina]KIG17686.1 Ribosomal large subunit pseudouridine synthase A [Enhygromyxa salina]